ncbi:MAG: TIGR03557 family F420-dependent LLM class oxidoreductase [Acidimicrobiales bacterium]
MSIAEPIEVGYWLSSEEHGPKALTAHARSAEEHGFEHAMISDHLHPWIPAQGHSPFVWSVLGAIAEATAELHVATGVTTPLIRMHPVVVAHAAATAAVQLEGRFALGLGTGELLNEHVTGARWPRPGVRRRMLCEAIGVIRALFEGREVNHDGEHFTVEHAQLFTRPAVPPPIWVAASGNRSAKVAGELADGLIALAPDPSLVGAFEVAGGRGKPRVAQLHVCWATDAADARRTAHRLWPNAALPGSVIAEVARPAQLADATGLVDESAVARAVVCGPDPEPMARAVQRFAAAGFTRVYVHQVGPDQKGFLSFWSAEVRPFL